jgi:hypothetical protein
MRQITLKILQRAVQVALVVPAANRGCHLYFARRVTFLPCADID